MNESEKNIETCLPESILAEVASVPQDPQFVSLVNESLDPLKQQAVQQAGSDAYNEVVASHQPYTFTSSVRQMKSNLILLLRRFWRFPFGSGTIRSLSDMWAHYITRLQGSETYGIPSRLDQLTDLPSAPLLVADRKISGVDTIDGISIIHLLCAEYADIEEVKDDNIGWDMTRNSLGQFPNAKKVTLGCRNVATTLLNGNSVIEELYAPYLGDVNTDSFINNCSALKRVVIGGKRFRGYNTSTINGCSALEYVEFSELEEVKATIGAFAGCGLWNCDCDVLVYPKLKAVTGGLGDASLNYANINKELRFPVLTSIGHVNIINPGWYSSGRSKTPSPTLELIEIGEGFSSNISLDNWSPTTALANNLQQFLINFRSFIVLRLANRKTTTALTLTLSANVYNAVTGANSGWASQHTLAELGITDNDLTDLETELGITSATIYATWLDTYTGANGIHWNVNKAN